MAKELRGSVYETATGYGIRWREHGSAGSSPAFAPRPRRASGSTRP